MKRIFVIFAVGIALFLAFAGSAFIWWQNNSQPVSEMEGEKRFVIAKGSSAEKVAINLYEEGLIRNQLAFKIYVQLSDKADKIQPGVFTLRKDTSLLDIVSRLTQNPDELWVTIPEGLRKEEVAEKVISGLELTGDKAESFRRTFLTAVADREGYLFPDTYAFPSDVSPEIVVSTLTTTFNRKTADLAKSLPSGYSFDEVVILASMLERETKTKDERPIVAGIMYNRLTQSWPLQIDAAVQYAVSSNRYCKGVNVCIPTAEIPEWWPILSREDLELTSPYNTYSVTTLPPAPIANPGLSSLEAAARPEESDYMFYLHDQEGQIHYARTLEEHNRNVRTYLR